MKTKILLVEDNNAMRNLVSTALDQHLDVDVFEAENGFAALKLIPDHEFRLIITTEAGEEDRKRGLAIGADGYLVKPFTEGELVDLVQQHLP